MKKQQKKMLLIAILISLTLIGLMVAIIVISKRKKNDKTATVASAVSSVVTAGYTKESFPLKKGMYGDNVRALQGGLIIQGYSCGSTGSDGKFGANTLKAVRDAFNDQSKTQVTQAEWKPYYTIYSVENNLPKVS